MKILSWLIAKAPNSNLHLYLLNLIFPYIIPFNKSHRFKVIKINSELVDVKIPYRRSNLNHIKGIHACAMATAAEYSAGLLVLQHFSASSYRLIMQSIKVNYLYQGRSEVLARAAIDLLEFEKAKQELGNAGKVTLLITVAILDQEKQKIAEAQINWQIKDWKAVKTK